MKESGSRRTLLLVALLALVCLTGAPAFSQVQGTAALRSRTASSWQDWFYGQRKYGEGAIPDNAVANAIAQRNAMPRNRGAFRQQDDTGAAASSAPQWIGLGPSIINSPTRGLISGRINSLAVDSTNPSTVYVAAAGGGVWKSTNRGTSWAPLTDNLPSLASGAVAVDPFTGEVWYGTGELNFCRDCYYGAGVYRSPDGGSNWSRVASDTFLSSPTSVISFDRRNQGVLFIGRSTALWKSADHGVTWHATLVGTVTDFVLNPADSTIAYAALGSPYGAAENGVYRSADGGQTWIRLAGGLPAPSTIGRTSLAIDPSVPTTVYALIARPGDPLNPTSADFTLNGLYRSLDGGNTWSPLANLPPAVFFEAGFAVSLFNMTVRVDPKNSAVIYVGSSDLYKSSDGGATWLGLNIAEGQHDVVFDPADQQSFYLINNSGVWRSSDGGQSFSSLNNTLAVTLLQGAALHPTNPNIWMGATQDEGNIVADGGFAWDQGRLGDSGTVFYDGLNPSTVYASGHYFDLFRSDDGGKTFPVILRGIDPNERVQFYAPFISVPSQSSLLYFATQRVWASGDRGDHWFPMSGDLTAGGTASISVLAVSASSPQTLYAGTSDGRVQISTDGGQDWTLTAPLPNRFVTSLAIHPLNPLRALAGLSGFGSGHVFRTDDGGATWGDISSNLPDVPVNAILMDAASPDKVYLATDVGVFVLALDGSWTPLNIGMPNVVVLGLTQNPQTGMLVASTHGRGAFVSTAAFTAPYIASISNSASLVPGPAAPGMSAVLRGSNLSSLSLTPTVPFPLPPSLGGVTVTVNGISAPLLSVSPNQVNFLVPFNITGPIAEVTLNNGNGQATVRVAWAAASPGIFQNGTGSTIFHGNGTPVSDAAPARAGEEVVMYSAGLGAVNPPVASGFPASSNSISKTIVTPLVRVGANPAVVDFSGLTPGTFSTYQVNFAVPPGSTGKLPVVIDMGAGAISNAVLMTTGP